MYQKVSLLTLLLSYMMLESESFFLTLRDYRQLFRLMPRFQTPAIGNFKKSSERNDKNTNARPDHHQHQHYHRSPGGNYHHDHDINRELKENYEKILRQYINRHHNSHQRYPYHTSTSRNSHPKCPYYDEPHRHTYDHRYGEHSKYHPDSERIRNDKLLNSYDEDDRYYQYDDQYRKPHDHYHRDRYYEREEERRKNSKKYDDEEFGHSRGGKNSKKYADESDDVPDKPKDADDKDEGKKLHEDKSGDPDLDKVKDYISGILLVVPNNRGAHGRVVSGAEPSPAAGLIAGDYFDGTDHQRLVEYSSLGNTPQQEIVPLSYI